MRQEYQDVIKYEIEIIFGRSIVSQRDCLDLSTEIFQKTNKQINVNTLRRFFGLIKSDYAPSHMTLNILSEYCGFQSAEEAYQFKETARVSQISGQANLVYYFISMFDKITVYDKCDKTFLTMVEQTIKFLNRHLGLVDKFHRLVAKTKNGQDYYFEQFVNIDKFNHYYKNGLRYYLIEKKSNEAAVFAHSVLVFNYWLNNNDAKLEDHYKQLIKFSPNGSLNGYIYCRYYAAILFYCHKEGRPVEDILVTLYKYYMNLETATEADQVFYFEYVIAEALVLTGHYNDAQFYIGQFCQRSSKIGFCNQKMSLQNIKLYKSIALNKTGQAGEAANVFNSIKPTEFHFTSKNYAALLYTYLTTELKKKVCDYNESYDSLINQTGFTRLKNLYPLSC
jgi:hypothetical protein